MATLSWKLDAHFASFIHWRWGSVMAVLNDLIELEYMLRNGFKLREYLRGASDGDDRKSAAGRSLEALLSL